MRPVNIVALLSTVLAGVLIFWTAPAKMLVAPERLADWLDRADVALASHGLVRRSDVVIRVNGQDAARGYSSRDCGGLLLVTRLPRTAQGWRYIAPGQLSRGQGP